MESHFRIAMNGLKIDRTDLERFIDSDYFPVAKKTKKGEKEINARSFVKTISYTPPYTMDLIIKHVPGPQIKPIDIIVEIFHFNEDHLKDIKILKTKQVMG